MKRKLLAVFLTAIMLVTLFPAASFAAGGQNSVGQLYWFYSNNVEVDGDKIVEDHEMTDPKDFEPEVIISTESVGSRTDGYFAIKKNGEYFVVTGLEEIYGDGFDLVESDSLDKAYAILYKDPGTYSIEAEYEGKTYSIVLEIALPDIGFYSSEDRSSDTFLKYEFHFADAVADDSDEAYFYLISKVEEDSEEMARVTIEEVDEELGEWYEVDIAGIEIGAVSKKTIGSEKFYVCRITVDKSYVYSGPIYICIEDISSSWAASIDIYDSAEYLNDNQLYWFYSDGVERNGNKIVEYFGETDSQNFYPAVVIDTDSINSSVHGYFAVENNGEYFVIDGVEDIYADAFEVFRSGSQDGSYWIEFKDFGTYFIETEYRGKTYSLDLEVALPDTGFYSSERRNTDTYFENEFRFADAPKDSNGEAYFYLISRVPEDARQMAKVTTGSWDYESEEWQEKTIKGVKVGAVSKKIIAYEEFYICKITVDKSYTGDGDEENFIRIADDASWCVAPIHIYGAEEPGADEVLYWLEAGDRAGYNVNVYDDGMLTVDDEMDIEELMESPLYITYLDTREGYFAVKRDGDYYVVDNVPSSSGDLKISKTAGGLYTIKANKLGKYKAAGGENNKLKLNISVELPDVGFYNAKKKSTDSYLNGVLDFNKAVNKSTDGKDAYFYIISDPFDNDINNIEASIGDWDENGKFESKTVNGVSIGNFTEEKIDGKTYYVCRIAVSKEYKGKGEEYLIYLSRKNSEGFYYAGEIKLYGVTETTPIPVPGGGGGGGLIIPPQETKEDVTTSTDIATSKKTTSTTVKDIKTETVKNEAGQSVSKTTASISKETAEKLVGQAVSNKVDTVEINVESNNTGKSNGEKSTELEIPKTAVDSIANNTDAGMVIKTGAGQIALDNKSLGAIASATGGDTVRIVINENTQLAESQKQAENVIGSNGTIFDVAAYIGNTRVYDLKDGSADVMLPVPEKLKGNDIAVISISDKGICQVLNHSIETVGANSFVKFKTSQFINYAIVEKADADKYIGNQNTDKVKALIKDVKLKVTTSKTSKKNIKVKVGVKTDKNLIKDIEDMGYTVKYKFYKSTKKTSKYSILKTKNTASYVNSSGKKGTKYYYKAKVLVYDGETLIAQTTLKQCSSGSRVWSK